MLGDHAMGQRQADTVAGGFRGEEGNEDALQIHCRNSGSRVFDFDDSALLTGGIPSARASDITLMTVSPAPETS